MVGPQASHQPDKTHVVIGRVLKLARTANAIRIPIDQQLQHRPWIELRGAHAIRIILDTQLNEVQSIDKGVIRSHRILGADVLLDTGWEKLGLLALTGDVGHATPLKTAAL